MAPHGNPVGGDCACFPFTTHGPRSPPCLLSPVLGSLRPPTHPWPPHPKPLNSRFRHPELHHALSRQVPESGAHRPRAFFGGVPGTAFLVQPPTLHAGGLSLVLDASYAKHGSFGRRSCPRPLAVPSGAESSGTALPLIRPPVSRVWAVWVMFLEQAARP